MDKVQLGNTNAQVSKMCLGTMYFGTKLDQKASFEMLDHYVARGGSFLDSANKYASWLPSFKGGESEEVIGAWLKERGGRDELFLTSKVGFPYEDIPRTLKKEVILSECDRSLVRMGVDYIDMYFAHAYDVDTPADEVMEAFDILKQQGKIRYAGASNFYGFQLAEAAQAAERLCSDGFVCLQQRHTYLEAGSRANFGNQLILTPEIEMYCAQNNVSLMAYSPLLSGAYVNSERPITNQYQSEANDYRMKNLRQVAQEVGVSENAVVLAWMLQNSPIIIPLVTGSSTAQLDDSFEALNVTLSEAQMALLNSDPAVPEKFS